MRRQPKATRFKKRFKGGKGRGHGQGGERRRGSVGLRACSAGRITARQRETRRRGIVQPRRRVHPRAKSRRRGYPQTPVTAKPRAVRMGKGKGSVSYWAMRVKRGDRRLEVRGRNGKEKQVAARVAKAAQKRPRASKVTSARSL